MSSISGGTDIISCFMLGNPLLPVFCSELQCYGLGMDVRIGEGDSFKGELVCCTPFVSMPIGFWNDTDGSRYNEAYFSRGDGHWWHGDLIELTGSQGSCGGVVVHGRSDATLKPGDFRIHRAEEFIHLNLPEFTCSLNRRKRGLKAKVTTDFAAACIFSFGVQAPTH